MVAHHLPNVLTIGKYWYSVHEENEYEGTALLKKEADVLGGGDTLKVYMHHTCNRSGSCLPAQAESRIAEFIMIRTRLA